MKLSALLFLSGLLLAGAPAAPAQTMPYNSAARLGPEDEMSSACRNGGPGYSDA